MMTHFAAAPVTANDNPNPRYASGVKKQAIPAPPDASATCANPNNGQNAALRVIAVDIAANGTGAAKYRTFSRTESFRGGDVYFPATIGAGVPR